MTTTTTIILKLDDTATSETKSCTDDLILTWMLPRAAPYLKGSILAFDESANIVARKSVNEKDDLSSVLFGASKSINADNDTQGRFDAIISFGVANNEELKKVLQYWGTLLNDEGFLMVAIPTTIGIFNELSYGAFKVSEENSLIIKRMIKPQFRLVLSRLFLLRSNDSEKPEVITNTGEKKKNRIDQIPIFPFKEKLTLMSPGLKIWFVAQKI